MQRSQSWFFYLCAIEGAAAIAALLAIPSEGGRLSPARLILMGLIAVLCIAWIVVGFRRPRGLDKLNRPVYLFTCVLSSLILSLLLFFLRYLNPQGLLSTYQRLSPLLWYLLILSVQLSFFFLFSYRGLQPANLSSRKTIYLSAFIAFCLLLLVFLLIAFTRLGLTPDTAYWSEPGVPIPGWGVGLALLGGACVLFLALSGRERLVDLLLPLAIYLLAIVLWLSVPADVVKNSFYMPIDPPTFQPFPYSDAGYYDQMAHSLLIGHPYRNQIPTRPLYIFLLTVLHLLFGENYRDVIVGQTFVLAIIPVVFYYLGKKLHSRAAGLVIALFFIFRELNTLLISSNTRVSNTKMLLVDLPTLLLLILACLFALRWLEQKDWKNAFLAGGTFGLLLLLRTQSVLVLPVIFLAALLVFGWRNKSFYRLVAVFLLGFVITIAPWLIHNYLKTGKLAFDATFQYATVASQYAYSGNLDMSTFDPGKGLGRTLIEFALKDPAFVFGFIGNHFLHAQVDGLLALPLIKPSNGLFEPVNLYWITWDGRLEWYNAILLLFYLVMIALGLGVAWRRWRWLGLLPLGFSVSYALATSVGRFSGWRYDLPADWVWYFYFGIGVAELLLQSALLFGVSPRAERRGTVGATQSKRVFPQLLFFASLFALLGGLPWLAEGIASPRYPDQSPEFLEQRITSFSNAPTQAEIESFLVQDDVFLQVGRVIYPRFFAKGRG
ncbi:MAG TPA: glycosyltransferase family 39 protein, partial [Anaerolineales bacterium]|nr:glycosyltransferase family 39 protein [Anaerolineales bacterium]